MVENLKELLSDNSLFYWSVPSKFEIDSIQVGQSSEAHLIFKCDKERCIIEVTTFSDFESTRKANLSYSNATSEYSIIRDIILLMRAKLVTDIQKKYQIIAHSKLLYNTTRWINLNF